MLYQTTITTKGQMVIPVKVRQILGFLPNQKITLEIRDNKQEVVLKPAKDIFSLAGKYKPKKVVSALKLREKFEKNYERV